MWREAFLLLTTFSTVLGESGVLFDVTTVYNVSNACKPQVRTIAINGNSEEDSETDGLDSDADIPNSGGCTKDATGQVYARTNARGLLLYDGGEYHITPTNFHLFEESSCDGILCGWEIIGSGWSLNEINNKDEDCSSDQHECYWRSTSYYRRRYYDPVDEGNCIQKNKFCNGVSDCNDGSDEDYCDIWSCEPKGFLCKSKEKCIPLKWVCDDHYDCSDKSDETDCQKYKSTTTIGDKMVSPIMTLSNSRPLCLAIVLHYNKMDADVFSIHAKDSSGSQHILGTVRSGSKVGWQVVHVNLTVPSNITSQINLIIEKVGEGEVQIFQISGCSSDDEEVTSLRTQNNYKRENLPVFKTLVKRFDEIKKIDVVKKQCSNGGVMTTAGCACKPGFTGSKCEVGCGEYRFGQDCEGQCSAHLQGCQGLLLCTSYHSCACAPGYKGTQCNQKCGDGRYGNDCLQKCGVCASGYACDIFTGRCSSCEMGFVPPLCQKEYVYYSEAPGASSTAFGKVTVTFDRTKHSGFGTPTLYQIQYSEMGEYNWYTYVSKIITFNENQTGLSTSSISEEIEGLDHGKRYRVRVLLLDSSFNKYDGDKVLSTEVHTKCDIPEEYDYKVNFQSSSTSLTFFWTYELSEYWCPVESYVVSWKEGWQWFSKITKEEVFILTDLIPGTEIEFKVCVKTCNGFGPYSQLVLASTENNGTSSVHNLHIVSATSTSVDMKWNVPIGSEDRNLIYKVLFKCVQQPACLPGCTNVTEGVLTQNKTSVTLSPLVPFTQYQVTVIPENGPESSIYVGTSASLPTEVPEPSSRAALVTNTSLTVFWDPVPVCSAFLLGYNYHLLKESESLKILESGFTKSTNITFNNLTASTDYVINVCIKTIAGWNPQSFLTIKTSTSATVPEVVRNLTVYTRGRNTLGLRWAPPRVLYGHLKAFTITHSLGSEEFSHIVEPTPCVPWPSLYCHTIQGLKANRKYKISVSARNAEIAEDGESTSITEITKESSPTAPEDLLITNKTSTSVNLQWHHPDLANGIIRSFVVSVEETEKHDQDSCCQVYPLVEIPVQEEMPVYQAEVTGLHPASTYYVSVTAKTVGLGPSRALTVHTRPPILSHFELPSFNILQGPVIALAQDLTWQGPEYQPEVNNPELYNSLVKTHLLIAISNETESRNGSGILNSELNSLLQEAINKPFYFIGEYTKDNMMSDSKWGNSSSPTPLTSGLTYQLVAVQVTEYNGAFNINVCYSSSFTV